MGANPNELRALTLLGQELGRSVVPWPGKLQLPKILAQYPDVKHPTYSAENDGAFVFRHETIAFAWRSIVPDGMFIEPQSESMFRNWNPRCHHLCVVEVETTTRMDERKLDVYSFVWDGFLCESTAWEFHVIVWDWYDQWRELDLTRLYNRTIQLSEPERNPHDLLKNACMGGNQTLQSRIRGRIAGARYAPIQDR